MQCRLEELRPAWWSVIEAQIKNKRCSIKHRKRNLWSHDKTSKVHQINLSPKSQRKDLLKEIETTSLSILCQEIEEVDNYFCHMRLLQESYHPNYLTMIWTKGCYSSLLECSLFTVLCTLLPFTFSLLPFPVPPVQPHFRFRSTTNNNKPTRSLSLSRDSS